MKSLEIAWRCLFSAFNSTQREIQRLYFRGSLFINNSMTVKNVEWVKFYENARNGSSQSNRKSINCSMKHASFGYGSHVKIVLHGQCNRCTFVDTHWIIQCLMFTAFCVHKQIVRFVDKICLNCCSCWVFTPTFCESLFCGRARLTVVYTLHSPNHSNHKPTQSHIPYAVRRIPYSQSNKILSWLAHSATSYALNKNCSWHTHTHTHTYGESTKLTNLINGIGQCASLFGPMPTLHHANDVRQWWIWYMCRKLHEISMGKVCNQDYYGLCMPFVCRCWIYFTSYLRW